MTLPTYQGTYEQYQNLPPNVKQFYSAPPITQTEPKPWVYQGPQPQGSAAPLPSSSGVIIPDAATPAVPNPNVQTEVFEGSPTTVTPQAGVNKPILESATNTTAAPPVQITVTTSKPQEAALDTALGKYELTPQPKPNIYGSGTSTPQTPIAFDAKYTEAEKAALSAYFGKQTQVKVANLGLTLAAPLAVVAAPAVAAKGALISLGLSQTAKAVSGGGLLTGEEAFQAGATGMLFSVGATGILGAAATKAPILLEKSFEGSLTRIAASGALGAAGGGVIGGAQAAVRGEDVGVAALSGARTGAILGLGLGVAGEVAPYAWSAAKSAGGKVLGKLSPERAMYSRVVSGKPTTSIADKVIGKISPERAMFKKALTPVETAQTPVSPFGKSEVKPYTSKDYQSVKTGKQFTEQLLYKPAPAVKTAMKPMLGTKVFQVQVPKTITITGPSVSAEVKAASKQTVKTRQVQAQVFKTETAQIQRQVQNPFLSYQGQAYPRTKQREQEYYETTVYSYPKGTPSQVQDYSAGVSVSELLGTPTSIAPVLSTELKQLPSTLPKTVPDILPGLADVSTPKFDTFLKQPTGTTTITDVLQTPTVKQTQALVNLSAHPSKTANYPFYPRGAGGAGSGGSSLLYGKWTPRTHAVKSWQEMIGVKPQRRRRR